MRPRFFSLVGVLPLLACNADPAASTPPATAITWPTPQSLDTNARGRLSEANVALVSRSPVPVLVPDVAVIEPVLVVESEYYAFSGSLDDEAHVAIQGTRKAHRHAGIRAVTGNKQIRRTAGFVSVNEGIRTASWIENGAAYTVDIECKGANDARCTDETFVVGLASRMVYVGGAGR